MTTTNHPQTSFFKFIWNERRNRNYLLIALGGMVVQFIIFKILYPFPDFFSDSYSFIWAAKEHMNVNLWPIGYSKYLLLIHYITHSDTFLIATQYLLVILSGLYFYFTILYWYNPSRSTRIILFLFLFFNPLFLYLSNYVASEALFLGLSVIWFTQLLWIINRPKNWMIFTHAIVLLLAFTVRYNAMYYPIISTVAFIMSRQRVMMKLAGIGLSVLLVGGFVMWTREKTYEYTGVRVFSALSGWHLANSALYMYPHITVDTSKLPIKTKKLNTLVGKYFQHLGKLGDQITPSIGAYFLKDPDGPLKRWMYHFITKIDDRDIFQFKIWALVSQTYSQYGSHLIETYPSNYVASFLIPNTKLYFLPPLEKMEVYNLGLDTLLSPNAREWFDFHNNSIKAISKTDQVSFLFLFPAYFLVLNIFAAFEFALLIVSILFKTPYIKFNKSLILILLFWISNIGFSIATAPIVFRYQVFPMVVLSPCILLSIDFISRHINYFKKDFPRFNSSKKVLHIT